MRILLTGSSGFVGRHVLRVLEKGGHDIVIATHRENDLSSNERHFDLYRQDPHLDYFSYFGKPDLLIHLAWAGLPDYRNPEHRAQAALHYSWISGMVRSGLKKVVVTGTCYEYGLQEGSLSESAEPRPVTEYGKAKNELRLQLEALQEEVTFQFNWIRLFFLYGEGQNPRSLLPQLQQAIDRGDAVFRMSKGDQGRDYLPVEEVARRIVAVALQNSVAGIVNCCSGQATAVIDLVKEYLRQHPATIALEQGYYPYPDYEPFCFWGDDRKMRTILKNEK